MEDRQLDRIEELLMTKDYADLTSEEKLLVQDEIGGEEVYRLYRLSTAERFTTKRATKKKLMSAMRARHQSWVFRIINAKVPAYAALTMLTLLLVGVLFFQPVEQVLVETPVYVKGETIRDTVFVQQIDTFYVDRPIYRTVYVEAEVQESTEDVDPLKPTRKSKSLAQQSGIRDILVKSD